MAKQFAVIGSPISHSLSPAIHSAAYKELGLDWSYGKFDVGIDSFSSFFEAESKTFSGFSVTMPLKEIALSIADYIHVDSSITNLANTLFHTNRGWEVHNTDIFGIERALEKFQGVEGLRVGLIGTGATSRSSIIALSRICPGTSVTVFGRNQLRVEEIVDFATLNLVKAAVTNSKQNVFDLTISTVPGSAFEFVEPSFENVSDPGVLFDVAYNPWPSPAAALWQKRGYEQISGINMLVWQAIGQLRLFVNETLEKELPSEKELALVMLSAASSALN